MKRRKFLSLGAGFGAAAFAESLIAETPQPTAKSEAAREPLLMRAGLSRKSDGTNAPKSFQHTLVRSFDSEGRLVVLTLPVDDYPHFTYSGAPLHVHHEEDEWIYILEGEFVAEVGGKRYRLKKGDSLLMPKRIPHRWSTAQLPRVGAIHLYTPAGRMDLSFDDPPKRDTPPTMEERKSSFESYGMTLLGPPLTKDEIDAV